MATSKAIAEKYTAIKRAERMANVLERALWLFDIYELQGKMDWNAMRPEDLTILRITNRAWRAHEATVQGRIIANEVARVVATVFGAK